MTPLREQIEELKQRKAELTKQLSELEDLLKREDLYDILPVSQISLLYVESSIIEGYLNVVWARIEDLETFDDDD